jgi:tetratricopeptide (TPR) repeat protein
LERLYYEWDWTGARHSLERALELAPGDAFVLNANAALNFHLGQLDSAVRLAELATDRDPLRASPHYNLAYFRFAAGDLDGAERALARTEELAPGYPLAGLLRVQIDLARGNVALAESRSEPNPILGPMADALTAEARGDREAALTAVRGLERDHADTAPYQIAGIYARLGEREAAFRWLDRALEMRDPGLIELRADPLLEPLRDDPRYRELLVRVGFSSSPARP